MQVKVTAVHTDNSTTVRTQSTQLMIENEFSSSIARGWSLAGIQRLYFPGAGYMVTEGDGSAVQFVALATPAVDFTVLTLESGSYVRRYPDSTAVFFATSGLMTEIRDRLGRRTTFAYDGSNRLTTITDPMKNIGRSVPYITIGYGANGISSIKTTGHGPDKTTTLTVLADHSLQTISDPDSRSTGFTYDASGRLSTVTDRQGGVQQFTYDSFSWKVTSVKLPQIPVDAGGGGTTNANPTITYSPWQDLGVPRTSTATIPKAPFSPADISGNVTDADGRILGFTPDRYGQPLTMTDRLANVTTITRSGIFPSTVTHPDGSIDTYTFTGARLTRQQLAGDSAITLTYGAAGQLATISGPGVDDETRVLNADGSVNYITYSDQGQAVFTYDPTTKLVATFRDPRLHVTSYSYDALFGNTSQITIPGNRTTSVTFDTYGRDSVTSLTSQPATTVAYDVMNRPVNIWDGVNTNPTTISYNETTRERTVQDPQGTVFKEEMNALGWLTKRYDPNASNGFASFRYSAGGLLKSTTNRRSQRIDYAYDDIGRLTSKTGQNASSDNFSYTPDGRITVGWNSISRDSIFVDAAHSTDSVVTWIGGKRFRVLHAINDAFTQASTISISSTTAIQFPTRTYRRDAQTGAIDSIDVAGFGTSVLALSKDMERTNTSWPTGVSEPEAYTSLHVPYDANFLGGSIADQFRRAYRYDVLGRIDTEQRNNGSNTSQRAFAYDGLGRLSRVDYRNQPCNVWPTSATVDTASGWNYTCASPDSSLTYTYDAVGNRTDHSGVVTAGNRYQSFNNASYAYDTDGNVIQKYDPSRFNRQFFWSAENRLDSLIQDGWWRIHYDYNAFGQPVRKSRGDPNSIPVDRYYLWDGDQLLADMDGSFNRVADYVYAPGIDEPFAGVFGFTTATSIRYHVQDELGNVLGHFEGTSINQLNEYDPWGTPSVGISGDSRLLWKGLMWEGDVVSLYYMRNRWYDPESGRFLSEDPIGIDGGLNQYTFVNDDPVNGFDPAAFRGDCYYGYSYSYSRSTGKIIPGSFSISGPYGICDEPSSGPVIEGGGMAGGGQVGGPRVGRSGGGGGGRSTGTPPLKGRVNRIAGELLGCVDAHYGLTGLIGRGVVFGGALPLSKRR